MIKDKSGPAFPTQETQYPDRIAATTGMSLRDYFAAKAMQGYLSDTALSGTVEQLAKASYQAADAMMEERNKK
tara:strand:+ start:724 stop:942 length:219 start_codon:yes stop_codon:yes gene_type:complete